MKGFKDYLTESESAQPQPGDGFEIELLDDTLIETTILEVTKDGVVVALDETAVKMLATNGHYLGEKAVSKAQQRFMGMVHAAQKGEKAASKEVGKVAKDMSKKDVKDFAATKHKGLPAHVDESAGFSSPEQEAKIRARLEQVQERDPDNSYKIVADEFDMTEEELRDALHHSAKVDESHDDDELALIRQRAGIKKSDVPAYKRKAAGERPLSHDDLRKEKEMNISGPEGLAALRRKLGDISEGKLVRESDMPPMDKEDLAAKRKALQDILMDPDTAKDPELKAEVARRKASLEKQATEMGLDEEVGDFTVKTISPADAWKKHTEPKKSKSEVPVDPKTGKTLYQKMTNEGSAQVQQVIDQLLDGELDPYDVMNNPQGDAQEEAAMMLQDMYDDISVDHHLHPDDDFEKIFDIMMDQLEQDHGHSSDLDEAEYQGREVPLGKPMRGDVKKSKVYVRDPQTGNVKKVNFGDPNMTIKKSNPERRKSFRARHNCDNPGPRTKARYWSCRAW